MTTESEEAYAQLFSFLKKHFPSVSDNQTHHDTDRIYRAFAECESPLEVYDPLAQEKNIRKIEYLLRELEISVDELHPRVSDAIWFSTAAAMIDGERTAYDCWQSIHGGPTKLQSYLAIGLAQAAQGTKVRADFNWEAVSLVDACRIIWQRCTSKMPPANLNPASPFASFLTDVLELTGTTSDARSAMNAWRKVRLSKKTGKVHS